MQEQEFDFVGIGDMVVDAFIKLDEQSVWIDENKKKICMDFGSKIPYKGVYRVVAVGNSANASVSAARLGLKSALVSNVGDDFYGQECINVLSSEKVATEYVNINSGKQTNYHYVLWYGDDRTILIKHQDFDYQLPNIGNPKWVYLSSLGENSLNFHKILEKYFLDHSNIKLAFQPGTYQIKFGKEQLAGIYKRTDLFFCNKEEAERILDTQNNIDIKILLRGIYELGPKTVLITDGVKGAYAFDGNNMFFMRPYPDLKPPLQRTGAGDAFSSTVTAAMALGKSLEEALRWGPVNSMSVVQGIGARVGLLTRAQLEDYLVKAPKDYQPIKI